MLTIGLTPIWTNPQDQIGGISDGGGPTFKIWLGEIISKIQVIKNLNYPHLVKMKLVQLGVVQMLLRTVKKCVHRFDSPPLFKLRNKMTSLSPNDPLLVMSHLSKCG